LLEGKGIRHSVISGEIKNRSEQVQQFQENPEIKVFVGQIQTTGLGLTSQQPILQFFTAWTSTMQTIPRLDPASTESDNATLVHIFI
jgi:hypothetical protein